MQRSSADIWFSKCVRAAADNTCARCGIQRERMECSHIHGRRHRTVRWDKLNAVCKCHACHRWWHENPTEGSLWFQKHKGQYMIDLLMEKKNLKLKVPKGEEKEIAKHYQNEFKQIEEKRAAGTGGYIDFVSYQ